MAQVTCAKLGDGVEGRLVLDARLAAAIEAWGTGPPVEMLESEQWDCVLCLRTLNWGAASPYCWTEGLHRCFCDNGWHFVCLPCANQHRLAGDEPGGLSLRLLVCPDGLRVARALMDEKKPDCETCHDEGITEVGGTEIGEPAKMVACGECEAGERVFEESRP